MRFLDVMSIGIDTEKIIEEKLEQVNEKYPLELMRKNAKDGSGSGADPKYWKIKNFHRQSKKP
jgi:hypothetical protein